MIIHSARPSDTLEAELRGQYEFEYGSRETIGVLSGPLSDRLAGRVVAKYRENEGFMDNLVSGNDEPQIDSSAIRGSVLYDPNDHVQVYGKLEYSEQDIVGTTNQLTKIDGNFSGEVEHSDLLSPLEDSRFDLKTTADSFNEEFNDTDSEEKSPGDNKEGNGGKSGKGLKVIKGKAGEN